MILESLAVTADRSGNPNLAPLGPTVDGPDFERFLLRPYEGSTTCENLLQTRSVVVHVTDDAALMARSVLGHVDLTGHLTPVDVGDNTSPLRLIDCHRFFQLAVTSIEKSGPMYLMSTEVIRSGVVRPFFGFNRAKHAVIEAAILVSRRHLMPSDAMRKEMQRLARLVEKTAGSADQAAFAMLEEFLHSAETDTRRHNTSQ